MKAKIERSKSKPINDNRQYSTIYMRSCFYDDCYYRFHCDCLYCKLKLNLQFRTAMHVIIQLLCSSIYLIWFDSIVSTTNLCWFKKRKSSVGSMTKLTSFVLWPTYKENKPNNWLQFVLVFKSLLCDWVLSSISFNFFSDLCGGVMGFSSNRFVDIMWIEDMYALHLIR